MILWRISNYSTLDGTGGMYVSGRWHTKGRQIVYCSLNPSTSLLETIVHMDLDSEDRPEHFQLLRIEGADALSVERAFPDDLRQDWEKDIPYSQKFGDRWLAERRSLLLQVPSGLVPETWNMLINPQHPEANLLTVTRSYEHPFDLGLL